MGGGAPAPGRATWAGGERGTGGQGEPRGLALALFLAFSLCTAACGLDPPPRPAVVEERGELSLGETLGAEIAPGEAHGYSLPAPGAGEGGPTFVHLSVKQLDADVLLRLVGPGGETVMEADRPIVDWGEEWLLATVEEPAGRRVEVRAFDADRPPGRYQLRLDAWRPATARDLAAARGFEAYAAGRWPAEDWTDRGFADREEAYAAALALWRQTGDLRGQGEVLWHRSRLALAAGRWREAEGELLESVELFRQAGDVLSECWARNSLAALLLDRAQPGRAAEQNRIILAKLAPGQDRLREALALRYLGQAERNRGNAQAALDLTHRANSLWAEHERSYRAASLHQLGVTQMWNLHSPEGALPYFETALELWPDAEGSERDSTLNQLGQLHLDLGRTERARPFLEEALRRRLGKPCDRARTLAKLAVADQLEGRSRQARERLEEAQVLVGGESCPRAVTTVCMHRGSVLLRQGEAAGAEAAFESCRGVYRQRQDPMGVAAAATGLAAARRRLGETDRALEAAREAVEIYGGLRPRVDREDFRTSFFAGVQEAYGLLIDLLQARGDSAEAFETAEEARARSLRDRLLEAGAEIRRGADQELLAREQELQMRLVEIEEQRNKAPRDSAALAARSEELVGELEEVRGRIRRRSPAYARLTQPGKLTLAEVQASLAEGEALVEVRLGDEGSHLWWVTEDSLEHFPLSSRGEIEPLAETARHWLQSIEWQGFPPPLCRLSEILLEPLAGHLALSEPPIEPPTEPAAETPRSPLRGSSGQDLIFVADGALHGLPLAALPLPGSPCVRARFLLQAHASLTLPSAGILVELRRRAREGPAGPLRVAVVADPVYRTSDPRLRRRDSQGPPRPAPTGTGSAATPSPKPLPSESFPMEPAPIGSPSIPAAEGEPPRLRYAEAEALALAALVPEGRRLLARGVEARRELLTSGELAGYDLLHFALHGVLEPRQPLLSHLVFSTRDAAGRPRPGRLYAHQVYNLELPAELVVLSACDTGSGQQLPGEGMVSGLFRGFLYAGARRLLVSLWPVDDAGTARLMTRFYRGLLEASLPPAEALREAQRSLAEAGAPPYRWAGFVLQGDPDPLPR